MPRQAHMLPLGILLAMFLTAPGCQTASQSGGHAATTPQPSAGTAAMVYGDWKLDRLGGQPLTAPAASHPPTLTAFDEGRAGGFGGVNRWAAPLNAEDLATGKFTLGPAATTMMAGTPGAMDLERQFFDALAKTRRYDAGALATGSLVLRDANGAELLRFVRGS